MNLLEAMRVYVAVVERGGLSGAASELRLDEAQVSERIDCLERYLGCRLLLCREHDDVDPGRSSQSHAAVYAGRG